MYRIALGVYPVDASCDVVEGEPVRPADAIDGDDDGAVASAHARSLDAGLLQLFNRSNITNSQTQKAAKCYVMLQHHMLKQNRLCHNFKYISIIFICVALVNVP